MPKSLLDAVIVRARGVRGGNMTRLRIFEWEEKKRLMGERKNGMNEMPDVPLRLSAQIWFKTLHDRPGTLVKIVLSLLPVHSFHNR